jgi:hypothetical protein
MRNRIARKRDAVPYAYLLHQSCNVSFDRPECNAERLPNFPVRSSLHQHFQNLFFAQCERRPAARKRTPHSTAGTFDKN